MSHASGTLDKVHCAVVALRIPCYASTSGWDCQGWPINLCVSIRAFVSGLCSSIASHCSSFELRRQCKGYSLSQMTRMNLGPLCAFSNNSTQIWSFFDKVGNQAVFSTKGSMWLQVLYGYGSQQNCSRTSDHHRLHWSRHRQVQPRRAVPTGAVQQSSHLQGQVSCNHAVHAPYLRCHNHFNNSRVSVLPGSRAPCC